MGKIKAYTGYSDRTKTYYYKNFEEVDKLPELGEGFRKCVKEINPITIDCEQPRDDNFNYSYYEVVTDVFDPGEEYTPWNTDYDEIIEYICIRLPEEEEETI